MPVRSKWKRVADILQNLTFFRMEASMTSENLLMAQIALQSMRPVKAVMAGQALLLT